MTIRNLILYKARAALILLLAGILVLLTAATSDGEGATEVVLAHQGNSVPPLAAAKSITEPAAPAFTETTPPEYEPSGRLIELSEAISLSLANNPGFASLEKEYYALDSLAWQAGRKPNPELELEFEEFGGTADAKGIRAMATSVTYTQPIERGGKRSKREAAASLEREIIKWDIAELEHGIRAGVRGSYAQAQAAQYNLQKAGGYRILVQRIYDTISQSVEAGRSARLELERLDVELAMVDLEIAKAQRELDQALLELAGNWGAVEAGFDGVTGGLEGLSPLPGLDDLLPLLMDHPAVARFDAEYEALCAQVDLENANSVPDMAVFGGLTRLNEADETVFKVGIAIDLFTNDRNEGNLSAAGYYLEQVDDNRASTLRGLEAELAALHGLANGAYGNYLAYGSELIPAATEAFTLTEEGYRYGKFELLDVLDAQRTLLELEMEEASALAEYHLARASIEALLNVELEHLTGTAEPDATDETTSLPAGEVTTPAQEHDHE